MNPNKTTTARRIATIAVPALALIVGLGIGSAGEPEPAAAPAPEVKTVTKTVTDYKTSESCLDAIRLADKVNTLASKAFNLTADAMGYVETNNVYGLNNVADELGEVQPSYTATMAAYMIRADECRSEVL